jgi:hypothetical protein
MIISAGTVMSMHSVRIYNSKKAALEALPKISAVIAKLKQEGRLE